MANLQINQFNPLSQIEGSENIILQTTAGVTLNTTFDKILEFVESSTSGVNLNIEDLGNVTITSPTNGETLVYSGGVWINSTSGFSGGGGSPTSTEFGNGLSDLDGTVGLGGALTQSTVINGDTSYNFDINNVVDFGVTNVNGDTFSMGSSNYVLQNSNGDNISLNGNIYLQTSSGSEFQMDGSGNIQSVHASGQNTYIYDSNFGGIELSDNDLSLGFLSENEQPEVKITPNSIISRIYDSMGLYEMSINLNSTSNSIIQDDIQNRGIFYASDYGSNWIGASFDNVLVNKKYVDDEIALVSGGGSSSTIFENGLETISSGTVGLGGALTQHTTITGGGNNLSIGSNTDRVGQLFMYPASTLENYDTGSAFATFARNETGVNATVFDGSNISSVNHSALMVSSSAVTNRMASASATEKVEVTDDYVLMETDSGSSSLLIHGVNGATYTDTLSNGGIKYSADYSGNYTSRSLVDKGYVDTQISSNIGTDSVGANGLTAISAGTIGLGGTLVQNTTILGDDNDYSLGANNDTDRLKGYNVFALFGRKKFSFGDFSNDTFYGTSNRTATILDSSTSDQTQINHQNTSITSSVILGSGTESQLFMTGSVMELRASNSSGDRGQLELKDFESVLKHRGNSFANESFIQLTDTSIQLRFTDGFGGNNRSNFTVSTTEATFTDDSANQRGIEYAGDYGTNFTDRSLVDKGFVTQQESIFTNVNTTSGSNFVASDNTHLILVDTSSLAVDVTLPATTSEGKWFIVKDSSSNAGVNNITVSGSGTNIDNVSSHVLSTNDAVQKYVYSGGNYYKI